MDEYIYHILSPHISTPSVLVSDRQATSVTDARITFDKRADVYFEHHPEGAHLGTLCATDSEIVVILGKGTTVYRFMAK